VNLVFQQHPELSEIGPQTAYADYLHTIFPSSKIKEIIYHYTPNQFETFENKYIKDTVQ